MVIFEFNNEIREIVYKEAFRRQSVNQAKGLQGRNRGPSTGEKALQIHLIGAAGEAAVAYYLGLEGYLFQETEAVRGSCDLPGIDVKCRPNHYWDLLVQLDDDLKKTYVLVTIQNRETRIVGWIRGKDVKEKASVKEFVPNRPCYVVPQSELSNPSILQALVQQKMEDLCVLQAAPCLAKTSDR